MGVDAAFEDPEEDQGSGDEVEDVGESFDEGDDMGTAYRSGWIRGRCWPGVGSRA